jgi:hypothetical protein
MTTEMTKALPYSDLPWLTDERLTALMEEAYELGESQFRYYSPADGGVDWDDVMRRLESSLAGYELPLTYYHPLMKKIKREYRKGYKENNE